MILVALAGLGLGAGQEYRRHTELEPQIFHLEFHAFSEELTAGEREKERVICMSKLGRESYDKEARYEYMKGQGYWGCSGSGPKFDDWDAEAKWYENQRDLLREAVKERREEAMELRRSLLFPFVLNRRFRELLY